VPLNEPDETTFGLSNALYGGRAGVPGVYDDPDSAAELELF
jgi:hypothetical protein